MKMLVAPHSLRERMETPSSILARRRSCASGSWFCGPNGARLVNPISQSIETASLRQCQAPSSARGSSHAGSAASCSSPKGSGRLSRRVIYSSVPSFYRKPIWYRLQPILTKKHARNDEIFMSSLSCRRRMLIALMFMCPSSRLLKHIVHGITYGDLMRNTIYSCSKVLSPASSGTKREMLTVCQFVQQERGVSFFHN